MDNNLLKNERKGEINTGKYIKPDLEQRVLTANNVIAADAGLSNWLTESNLSDVGITIAYLTDS